MLGLRCKFALGLPVRDSGRVPVFPPEEGFVEVGLEGVFGVLGAALARIEGIFVDDVGARGDGEGGVGEAALRRALFAFWVRSFSSSSEELLSEFFALKSMLIATDSMLLRELPNEGARLMPGGQSDDPVNVSERRTRRGAITTG